MYYISSSEHCFSLLNLLQEYKCFKKTCSLDQRVTMIRCVPIFTNSTKKQCVSSVHFLVDEIFPTIILLYTRISALEGQVFCPAVCHHHDNRLKIQDCFTSRISSNFSCRPLKRAIVKPLCMVSSFCLFCVLYIVNACFPLFRRGNTLHPSLCSLRRYQFYEHPCTRHLIVILHLFRTGEIIY